MTAVKREIEVVGAVIVRDGLVFCVQRGPDGSLPGMWEFPGGKIEEGEAAAAALEREIQEELRCGVNVGNLITTTAYEYEFGTVRLTTFYCQLAGGDPELTEHAALRWLAPEDLDDLEWAPADVPAVAKIQCDLR
jgi:8-oxo-dGTP diphosphatase